MANDVPPIWSTEKITTNLPHSTPSPLSTIKSNPQISVIVTSCVCIVIAIVGILGNLLVICVLAGSHTRLVYEIFCVGLAVTDLTYLTFTIPITVVQYYFRGWIFGLFWCKVFNFVVQVTVFSSAFMLLGLTTSRFLSVVLPWQNLKMTKLQAKLFCLGAWIAGVIFASPVLVFQVLMPASDVNVGAKPTRVNNSISSCTENGERSSINKLSCVKLPVEDTSVVFCRGLFPSQSSRMGYQLLVLLSTYVIPFVAILIMNSTIVYKLQNRTMIDRGQSGHKRKDQSISRRSIALIRSSQSTKSTEQNVANLETNAVPETDLDVLDQRRLSANSDSKPCSPWDQTDRISGLANHTTLTTIEMIRQQKMDKNRRTRTKATKLVVLVTTLWCVCWLPTHIINSWLNFDEASFPFTPEMVALKLVSQTLSFVASCVNPVVYGIMTGTFKETINNKIFRRKHKMDRNRNCLQQRVSTVVETELNGTEGNATLKM